MFLFSGNNRKKAAEELPDAEILLQYKIKADKELIAILFKRYAHLVYAVCYKYLKDNEESRDAVMNIFEKLIDDLKKHEIINFKSWLFSVAKNHCLMKLRKHEPGVRMDDYILGKLASGLMENEDELHQNNMPHLNITSEQLKDVLAALKEEQRVCIELFYLEEKTYNEITELTGYAYEKVKSYIQNGKRNMKIILSKANGGG